MSAVFSGTWQIFHLGLRRYQCPGAIAKIVNTRSFFSQCSSNTLRPSLPVRSSQLRRQWFQASPIAPGRQVQRPGKARVGQPRLPASRIGKSTVRLSRSGILALFGKSMTREDGNELLSKLQDHRYEGTLDAKIDYPEHFIAAGLQHLRSRYPIDEDAAIIARVDRELENDFRLPQTNPEQSPYAHSGLEKIRKENEERYEKEKAGRKEDIMPKSLGSMTIARKSGTPRDLVRSSEEMPEWIQQCTARAQITEWPQISTFARLGPTGLFALAVVVLSLLFAQNYTPPSRQARLFPDTPPAAATLLAVLGINVSVFVLWRIPQMWAFMNKYFITLPLQPRAAQMLLAGFSHQQPGHLFLNMIPMWFIGVRRRFRGSYWEKSNLAF